MGRSSKQGSKTGGMEIETIPKFKEEPHLSGAYIRSLVKQLTSSRTKDPLIPKDPDCVDAVDGFPAQSVTKWGPGFSETQQTPPPQQHPPQHHKKQVRRRLHTSRPYQERLLNMAEARREIVTALKFHRAAMKHANEQQPPESQSRSQSQSQPQLPHPPPQPHPSLEEQQGKIKSRRNPRIYPSSTANFSNYLDNLSYSSLPYTSPNPFSWPASPTAPSPATENFNLALPNQTLGLNLNFHDFNNLDATLYLHHPPSIYSSPSSSPPLSIATEEVPSAAISQEGPAVMTGGGLHPAMDDEEMAEIRSIGEQHDMEWNDTMNLATSAWWFKFLKTMEIGPEVQVEDDGYHPFVDEIMEFPSWLNANDSCLQQHLNDYCPEDYLQDPALPCMDIGAIEGMDGEWLA